MAGQGGHVATTPPSLPEQTAKLCVLSLGRPASWGPREHELVNKRLISKATQTGQVDGATVGPG